LLDSLLQEISIQTTADKQLLLNLSTRYSVNYTNTTEEDKDIL